MAEIAHDFSPLIRVYKDGRVERLLGTATVPPSLDPGTNVQSKDVVYSPQQNLSSRLYIPKNTSPDQKLPVLVYYHGGGFCIETAFSPTYHNYLNTLVAEANVLAVSVDYRRAPEHPLPAAYDDSWAALEWVASHVSGDGPEEWLNSRADLGKVFLSGDSAGGNIAHNVAIKIGQEKLVGLNVIGTVLIHPYFWGTEPVGNETEDVQGRVMGEGFWRLSCPTTSGCDDPLINPAFQPKLSSLGCTKVLVFVAEKDFLKNRGWYYRELLAKSGWGGTVEVVEAKGENHVFHLFNPTCDNAVAMLRKFASFMNEHN